MNIISKVQDMIVKAFNHNAATEPAFVPVIYHLAGKEYPGVVVSISYTTDVNDNPLPLAFIEFIQMVNGRARFNSANVSFDMLDEVIA